MTTTESLIARLRQCEAIRDLAEQRARKAHNTAADAFGMAELLAWESGPLDVKRAWVEGYLRLILDTSDPYAMAGLRAVCERTDKRPINGGHKFYWHDVSGREAQHRAELLRAQWSRLEHGPVEAFLAECLTVLETDHG